MPPPIIICLTLTINNFFYHTNLLNKLLTAIHTVRVSVSPTYCVLILRAIFNGNVYIDHLATHRAKAHRSVCVAVISVETTVFLPSHRFLLIRCLTSCLRI